MKIRTDFVTNSSSSSFILAFDNSDGLRSYENFKEVCEACEYDSLLNWVELLKKEPGCTDKETALDMLYRYYSRIYFKKKKNEFLKSNDNFERNKKLRELDDDRIKSLVEQDKEYLRKKLEIEQADLIVMGEAWDTDGNLLSWAIRNGFLEDIFRNNCVLVWNVG